jgi:AcrR family transcriptional regulator
MMQGMQPRGRKRELRGSSRQRQLVTSLIELLNEGRSLGEVTIEDIAKRAGITRAAFYYFFESNDQQVRVALGQAFDAVVPRVAARLIHMRDLYGASISPAAAQDIARTLLWANERNFYRISVAPSTDSDWEQLVEALYGIWIGVFAGAREQAP